MKRINSFTLTRDSVVLLSCQRPTDVVEHGFRTLVLNRTRRGGILAQGESFTRQVENGAGNRAGIQKRSSGVCGLLQKSRPASLSTRQTVCRCWPLYFKPHEDVALFIDPPYTGAGGKRAGKRLYAHNDVDHARLFSIIAESNANFLMTYDRSLEIESLIETHKFHAVQVVMKSGHHVQLPELVITRHPTFTKVNSLA